LGEAGKELSVVSFKYLVEEGRRSGSDDTNKSLASLGMTSRGGSWREAPPYRGKRQGEETHIRKTIEANPPEEDPKWERDEVIGRNAGRNAGLWKS
jgi:hypothetical protein